MEHIAAFKARESLLSIFTHMQKNPEPFVKNPGKDFTRNRSISLPDVLSTVMNFESYSLSKELYHYYSPRDVSMVPSKSAFIQQRDKLNSTAFSFILSQFNKLCPVNKKYQCLHVLGIDGSDINIPADIKDCATFIPYNSKNGGYHQLHVNVSFDLIGKRYIDAVIQPRGEFNETAAACNLVDRNPVDGKCLYICDRGYGSFNLMAHIIENGHYFLIRAKEVTSSTSPYHSLDLPSSDEFDVDIHFTLTRRKKKQDDGQFLRKMIHKNMRFDYIEPDNKDKVYPISYRLIKIPISNNGYEYLLTNLPKEDFGLDKMKYLYHLRWEVETSFLFLKYNICLNYFHSIKRESLYQEVYAKLLLFNFVSYIIDSVQIPEKKRKYDYKISFSDAVYLCKDFLTGRKTWNAICRELLRHLTPIRPGRSYERKMASQRLRSLQHRS